MLQPRDGAAIRAFLAEQGLGIDALELARLVRFDPRRRAVICASALVDSREVVLALGAINLDAPGPDLIVTAADSPTALRELLVDALCGRTHARAA